MIEVLLNAFAITVDTVSVLVMASIVGFYGSLALLARSW